MCMHVLERTSSAFFLWSSHSQIDLLFFDQNHISLPILEKEDRTYFCTIPASFKVVEEGFPNMEKSANLQFQRLQSPVRSLASRFRRVCVYCGSSPGRNPSYQLAAIQLGKQLVERNIDLVYGGGSIGLMGLVSQVVYDGGRHVLGVIPRTLMPRELTGETIGEVRAVSGMHQRKAEMARHADAFIALPGIHPIIHLNSVHSLLFFWRHTRLVPMCRGVRYTGGATGDDHLGPARNPR
ncbi:hypothetical protein SAY87_012442 [Trapa incisa]|uniref:Cytokinin riboside 5'-monophosphate phosphoribohydrolase n=1 Tax=Trapa incisa TaxID=236973 RepID=A0AAN7GPC1_9MYRT|nr:hypothetical protein SAY87_012442 [Trapa incisa]